MTKAVARKKTSPSKRVQAVPAQAASKPVRRLAVRNFAAAQTDRLLSGWKWDGGFSANEIRGQLATIRSRSREMSKNNPHMKRFLQLVAINVVGGDGFSLKSTPHDGFPGRPDYRPDTMAARFIEYHWWRFCNARDPETGATWCDAAGRKTMTEKDLLNVKTWARDGEYIELPQAANNPYGITFRTIRPDALDETYNREGTANQNPIYCGVEKDARTGRHLAYYFHTTDARSEFIGARGHLVRIAARDVIHGFTPDDEDQTRGIPWAHAILIKLKMLEEYDKAELTAARDEACSVRSYYSTHDDPDGILDLTTEEGAEIAQALTAEKEPGQSEVLPPGWDSKVNTPQHPNRELTAFKVSMLKDIASGLGVEFANFANDWAGVSYSSVRQGTISERDGWILLQNQFIAQSKVPMFLLWLRSFLASDISGQFPAEKFEKFAEHEFRGRRWMWVDPMRDMNAAKVAVENGWKTNTDVAADLGTDYADNLDTLRRENEMEKAAGIKSDAPESTEPKQ